ncbi:replication initiator protein A [Peptoniphilaceae bacterium SGI.131]
MNNFKKINKYEKLRNTFYIFPKWLNCIDVSANTKIVYMFLLDRYNLSVKNNWVDDEGNIYLYFSYDSLAKITNTSKVTIVRAMKELEEKELLIKKRQLNKPNRIYLLEPTDQYLDLLLASSVISEDEFTDYKDKDNYEKNNKELDGKQSTNVEIYSKYQNDTTRSIKMIPPEVSKRYSNNTNINNNLNNNIYNNLSINNNTNINKKSEGLIEIENKRFSKDEIKKFIHQKIFYEENKNLISGYRRTYIDDLVDILTNAIYDKKDLVINSAPVEYENFLKITSKVNMAVFLEISEFLINNQSNIKNVKGYCLSMLYNGCEGAEITKNQLENIRYKNTDKLYQADLKRGLLL